jgi:hypothetical protein
VEYVFQVGKNRSSELRQLAAKGLKQEQQLDTLNFRWHESVIMTSPRDNLLARGKVMNVERIFGNGYMDSLYEGAEVSDKNVERKPYDVETSPYVHVRYWGETSYALIGYKGDPDPPGPDGAIMLYYYNKQTGLMQELRFYSTHNCGRGVFLWNQGVSGIYFNTQIQKRTWSPPTELWEEASVIRRNIRLMEETELKRAP